MNEAILKQAMRELLAILLCTTLFSSCSSMQRDELQNHYPIGMVTAAAEKGDVISELDLPPSLKHMAKMNHTASIRAFREYFAAGLDIDTTDWYGVPAVGHAAAIGDMTLLRRLIAEGADLHYPEADREISNEPYFNDLSPVALAARHGQTNAVRLLLEHNATPRGVSRCILEDRIQILNILRINGADLHAGEYSFNGEFYPNTCLARSEKMLRYLIDHGVSSNIPLNYLLTLNDRKTARKLLALYEKVGICTHEDAENFRKLHKDSL